MGPGILNRPAYNIYLLSFGLTAGVLLIAGERLPGALGSWVGDHPLLFLALVGCTFSLLAILPLAVLLAAVSLLGRSAQRAVERFGAGDIEGGKALLRRIERWTPRLRWILLHPSMVVAFQELTCREDLAGLAVSLARPGGSPAGTGTPAPRFRIIGTDAAGHRFEAGACATREEADRRRETLEGAAGGASVRFHVEGPEAGTPG
jgi:hypothetical protein